MAYPRMGVSYFFTYESAVMGKGRGRFAHLGPRGRDGPVIARARRRGGAQGPEGRGA